MIRGPPTLGAVRLFNGAFNRNDVDGVMAAMTEDCVFENTCPPPGGKRHAGQNAVRTFRERFFSSSPGSRFTTEEDFASGERCVVCQRYDGTRCDGTPAHARSVDLFRVRGEKGPVE